MIRLVLSCIAWIAPRERRPDWREEWQAELGHRRTAGLAGARVVVEAVSHALWLRQLHWSFVAKDVRHALRMLVRQPLLSVVVVGTLSLGIGGVVTMFAVIDGVVLAPLPYRSPNELVWMYGAFRANDSAAVSPADFVDYRARNDAFSSLGAMTIGASGVTVVHGPTPRRMQATHVTAGLIATLGVPPALGRDFGADEESLGGPQVVILSDRAWRDLFDQSPDVIGQSIIVDARPRTIVGVMPAGFELPYDAIAPATRPPDLYLPLPFDSEEARIRRFHFLRAVGRLDAGVTLPQAQERMDIVARELEAVYPENETWHLRLLPLKEQVVGNVRPLLLTFLAAVGAVLLIACANVASLLLARASGRRNEMAIRMALGASRARVVRQLLVEGLTLSLAGAAGGLLVSAWSLEVLKRTGPVSIPRLGSIGLDATVVAVAVGVAVAATLLFGLAPALEAARPTFAGLGDDTRRGTSRSRLRLRRVLVAGEIALSVMLLSGAGLLARSLMRLEAVDLGFETRGVMFAQISLPPEAYDLDRVELFFTSFSERLSAIPGIEAAALATSPPFVGGNDTSVHRPELPPATAADRRFAQIRWIQGSYFQALGIPLLSGRLFDDRTDGPDTPTVLVVSRTFAEEFFPGENPAGRQLTVDLQSPVTGEVVGVVADARVFGQSQAAPSLIYMSARQAPTNFMNVFVRTTLSPELVAGPLRDAVRQQDATIALDRLQPMDQLARESVARPRFTAGLGTLFAAVALALTLVGVYGMLAYAVSLRQREIGVRLALGARSDQVVRMLLRQGAAIIVVGLVVGLGGALAAGRWLSSLLIDVTSTDPVVLVTVTLVLALSALAAVTIPARRASRIDPVKTLRSE